MSKLYDALAIVSNTYTDKHGCKVTDVTCPLCRSFTQGLLADWTIITCMKCSASLHRSLDTIPLKYHVKAMDMYIIAGLITRMRAIGVYCVSDCKVEDGTVFLHVTTKGFDKVYGIWSHRRYMQGVKKKLPITDHGGPRVLNMKEVLPYIGSFPSAYRKTETIVLIHDRLPENFITSYEFSGMWEVKWKCGSSGADITRRLATYKELVDLTNFLKSALRDHTIAYFPWAFDYKSSQSNK